MYAIAAATVLIVSLVVVAVIANPTEESTQAIEENIAVEMSNDSGIIVDVQCPDTANFSNGSTFHCVAVADGQAYDILVRFQNDKESYFWRVVD